MAASAVMTVRIDAELLAALKEKVRRDGRTVSAAVVELIRNEVRPKRVRPAKRRRTMGMFAEFEAPDLDEFVQLRRGISHRLMASVVRKAKRR
jgi:Ribbon-helix-helix protein, copG family